LTKTAPNYVTLTAPSGYIVGLEIFKSYVMLHGERSHKNWPQLHSHVHTWGYSPFLTAV